MEKITAKTETLGKVYKALEKNHIDEFSFEYLVGNCFPKIMKNIKEEMHRQYTLGYIAGLEEGKNDGELGLS